MAQTVSITNNGNGKFTIKDSDGQTRVVDLATANAESAKSKVKITNPIPNPSASSDALFCAESNVIRSSSGLL